MTKSYDTWLKQVEIKFGNKFDYSNVNYIHNKKKVNINCSIHGSFWQTPAAHLKSKSGCNKCGRLLCIHPTMTIEEFFKRANTKHNNFYIYTKAIFTGLKCKIIITCPNHGDFIQKANVHLKNGCIECRNAKLRNNIVDIVEAFIIKHNNKYTYPDFTIYKNNRQKITIKCPIHGNFLMKVLSHMRGNICTFCSKEARKIKSYDAFIKKANLIHNNFYDYTQAIEYKSSNSFISIGCPKHGVFIQLAWQHSNGNKCLECSKEDRRLTLNEFLDRARKKHNDKYDYSKVSFTYVSEKIKIICPDHGQFSQSVASHIRGSGCSKCSKIVSQGETEWLNSYNISMSNRNKAIIINDKIFFPDGRNDNTIYEYYGDFWHGNPKFYDSNAWCSATKMTFGQMYNKTLHKEKVFNNAGYDIITIWESDWLIEKKNTGALIKDLACATLVDKHDDPSVEGEDRSYDSFFKDQDDISEEIENLEL